MPFPRDNPEMKLRGDICKVCDRKFYIRLMVHESRQRIESQRLLTESLQAQLLRKEAECKALDANFEEFKDRSALDAAETVRAKEELERRRSTLISEKNVMNEEVRYLYQRKQDIATEQGELSETIKVLREELEDLD